MKVIGENDYCLIVDNLNKMKKIILLLTISLCFACCSAQLTEKVEVRYPNGQPELILMLNKSGECVKKIEYYDSGQVKMEGGMKNGQREGEWTAYFPDGRVQSHGFYKNGVRTGAATVYRSNGNLLSEGFYKEGKHSGHWKWYDEQGNLIREENYPE